MKIVHLTIVLLVIGLVFALLASTAPSEGWFESHNLLIDRMYRFFDVLLHVLGVAALIKYLYSKA